MRLELKTSLLFFSILLVIVFPIFFTYYKYNKELIIKENFKNLEVSSKNLSEHIKAILVEKSKIALTLSSNPHLKELLISSNSEYSKLSKEQRGIKIDTLNSTWKEQRVNNDSKLIGDILDNRISKFLTSQKSVIPKMYGEIFLTNRYGCVVASTDTLSTFAHSHKYWWRAAFNKGRGKVFFDDRGFDESVKGYVLGVVIPVVNDSEIIGVLKANINIESLFNSIITNWSENRESILQIVRSKGLIIGQKGVKPLSTKVDSAFLPLLNKNESTAIVDEMLVSTHIIPFSNKEYGFGGSYSSIDHILGNDNEYWHIIIKDSLDSVLSEGLEGTFTIILTLFLISLLLIVFLIVYLNRFISTPINRLLKTIKMIQSGKKSRVSITTPINEVEFLAKSFNSMLDTIDKKEEEIKEKHSEILELLKTLHLQSKEQLKQVLNSSLDGVQAFKSIRDESGEIVDFEYIFSNSKACELLGKKEDELIGKRLLESVIGHDESLESLGNRSLFDIYKEVVEKNISKELTFYFENKDGLKDWFINKSVKLEDGFVVTFSIITKEVEQRNILASQSRLATMGEMISMIAHQWRQPITTIMGIMANIYDMVKYDELEKKALLNRVNLVEDTLNYMSTTIDDFRSFFTSTKRKTEFNILDKIISSYSVIEAQLKNHSIEFMLESVNIDGEKKEIDISKIESHELDKFFIINYSSELQQVILSLISNAKDALLKKDEKRVIEVIVKDKNSFYEIEVRDNGVGIKSENLKKVFEPYFTTKTELQGTGLGLYMSKMVIEDSMRGKIFVKSKEGIGSSLFIILDKDKKE